MLVCTGFNPAGYQQYGQRFLETFSRYWPSTIDLFVYGEERVTLSRGEYRSLWSCAGAREFYEAARNNPERCGRKVREGWREKDKQRGYCYRFDTAKFHKQLFIPEHASLDGRDGDILTWLDADVVTHSKVPSDFVGQMLGRADLCYLGRPGTHSEIGFWAVRLNKKTRKFVFDLAEIHRSGAVFALREWHSAFVFDHVRAENEKLGLITHNITPKGRRHVWFQSPLAQYADHVKGEMRKKLGYSPMHSR